MRAIHNRQGLRIAAAAVAGLLLWMGASSPPQVRAERLPDNGWRLLAVAFPDDRDVELAMGGAERTLTSKGLAKVNWENNVASVELNLEGLPGPAEAGWTAAQYVLWAVDNEKRTMNLGPVPASGSKAELSVQVPFRIFGLLVTAEKNPQTSSPSTAVALESLLPTDPRLVVPVFRVNLTLAP